MTPARRPTTTAPGPDDPGRSGIGAAAAVGSRLRSGTTGSGSGIGTGRLALAGAVVAGIASVVAWQREPATPVAPGGGPVADGATLFQAKGCAVCHAGPGTIPANSGAFPDLTGASTWAGERRPGLDAADYLAESMREPWAFISPEFVGGSGPTNGMPRLELSDAEIDAIVDYLLADRGE